MKSNELKPIDYLKGERLPFWWEQAIQAKEMLRLKDVGMNCGLEYTSFPLFRGILSYSRYTHSLGVAKIVWRFTHDDKQTLAALYHDIASPCFAHVIDFMHGDYLSQESTEDGTTEIIAKSQDIQNLLRSLNLSASEVDDYHLYPIADNDSPKLSADRLEYTFSNALNLLGEERGKLQSLYEAIEVLPSGELGFQKEKDAHGFASLSLRLGAIYSCDEDRFAMETLSRLLSKGLSCGVLEKGDLHSGESLLIRKLSKSPLSGEWASFRELHALRKSATPKEGWLQVKAKKRYIDPLVVAHRLSSIDPSFAAEVEEYLSNDFECYLKESD